VKFSNLDIFVEMKLQAIALIDWYLKLMENESFALEPENCQK